MSEGLWMVKILQVGLPWKPHPRTPVGGGEAWALRNWKTPLNLFRTFLVTFSKMKSTYFPSKQLRYCPLIKPFHEKLIKYITIKLIANSKENLKI